MKFEVKNMEIRKPTQAWNMFTYLNAGQFLKYSTNENPHFLFVLTISYMQKNKEIPNIFNN